MSVTVEHKGNNPSVAMAQEWIDGNGDVGTVVQSECQDPASKDNTGSVSSVSTSSLHLREQLKIAEVKHVCKIQRSKLDIELASVRAKVSELEIRRAKVAEEEEIALLKIQLSSEEVRVRTNTEITLRNPRSSCCDSNDIANDIVSNSTLPFPRTLVRPNISARIQYTQQATGTKLTSSHPHEIGIPGAHYDLTDSSPNTSSNFTCHTTTTYSNYNSINSKPSMYSNYSQNSLSYPSHSDLFTYNNSTNIFTCCASRVSTCGMPTVAKLSVSSFSTDSIVSSIYNTPITSIQHDPITRKCRSANVVSHQVGFSQDNQVPNAATFNRSNNSKSHATTAQNNFHTMYSGEFPTGQKPYGEPLSSACNYATNVMIDERYNVPKCDSSSAFNNGSQTDDIKEEPPVGHFRSFNSEIPEFRDYRYMNPSTFYLALIDLKRPPASPYAGEPHLYQSWLRPLKRRMDRLCLSATDRIEILESHTKGEVHKVIETFKTAFSHAPETALKVILDKLNTRFGSKVRIAAELRERLSKFIPIRGADNEYAVAAALRELSDLCVTIQAQMSDNEELMYFNLSTGLELIRIKLPDFVNSQWRDEKATYLHHYDSHPTFAYFCSFLENIADTLCSDILPSTPIVVKHDRIGNSLEHSTIHSYATAVVDKSKEHFSFERAYSSVNKIIDNRHCPLHMTNAHTIHDCKVFNTMKFNLKRLLLRSYHLCIKCLNSHNSSECDVDVRCAICKRDGHIAAMHIDQKQGNLINFRKGNTVHSISQSWRNSRGASSVNSRTL